MKEIQNGKKNGQLYFFTKIIHIEILTNNMNFIYKTSSWSLQSKHIFYYYVYYCCYFFSCYYLLFVTNVAKATPSSAIPSSSSINKMINDVKTLRDLAKDHGKYFGSCENIQVLSNKTASPKYQEIIGTQFSLVTAENSCKFTETEYTQNSFQFTDCDTILSHAQGANQVMRGHNLVWGKLNPPWLTSSNFSKDEMTQVMKKHIETVVKHYDGKAFCWDVVNEAVTDLSNETMFKNNDWYPMVPDYVDQAYLQANLSRSSNEKLFYNDYNIASSTGFSARKSQLVYNLVYGMKGRNIPIDGVGLQLHVDINYPSVAGVIKNMGRLGELGLWVHMTEIDVACSPGGLPCLEWGMEEETKQAEVYAALLNACLEEEMCESYEMWGFTDRYTWLGSDQHPLLFDENYEPKLAVQALIDTFNGNLTWVNNYYSRVGNYSGKPSSNNDDDEIYSPWLDFRGKDEYIRNKKNIYETYHQQQKLKKRKEIE